MPTNIVVHVRHHMDGLTWNLLFLTLWVEDCDVFRVVFLSEYIFQFTTQSMPPLFQRKKIR